MRSRVELFEQIRRDRRLEELSVKELAERHKVHRRTVRQALAGAVPPPRKPYERRPRPATDPWAAVIDAWLLADKDAPRKQRHTARRVWQRLVAEHGAVLSETTVSRYVARRRVELGLVSVEVSVPQSHLPGAEAEVDFGELHAVIAGSLMKCWMFVMRLSHCGRPFDNDGSTSACQPSLCQHPEILTANVVHRRLIRRHGRHFTDATYATAVDICAGWRRRSDHDDSVRTLLWWFHPDAHEVRQSDPTVEAAAYPQVVAVMRVLTLPGIRELPFTVNGTDRFIAEIRRTAASGYRWSLARAMVAATPVSKHGLDPCDCETSSETVIVVAAHPIGEAGTHDRRRPARAGYRIADPDRAARRHVHANGGGEVLLHDDGRLRRAGARHDA